MIDLHYPLRNKDHSHRYGKVSCCWNTMFKRMFLSDVSLKGTRQRGFILSCHLLQKRLISKLLRQSSCFMLRVLRHFFHPLTCLHGSWSVTWLAYPAVKSQPGRMAVPLQWYQLNIWGNNKLTRFQASASKRFSTKVKFLVAIINAQARVLTILPFVKHSWLNVVSCSW
jgi:hypothetical protein